MAVSVFDLELVCLQLTGNMYNETFYLPRREQVDLPANFIPHFSNGLVHFILKIPQHVTDTRWHTCFKDKCTEVILDLINNTEQIIMENTLFTREPYTKSGLHFSDLQKLFLKLKKVSIPI